MKITEVTKGLTVKHRRMNAGHAPKTAVAKIGVIYSSDLQMGKTSTSPELVEVNFGSEDKPVLELIRYNRLEIMQQLVAV